MPISEKLICAQVCSNPQIWSLIKALKWWISSPQIWCTSIYTVFSYPFLNKTVFLLWWLCATYAQNLCNLCSTWSWAQLKFLMATVRVTLSPSNLTRMRTMFILKIFCTYQAFTLCQSLHRRKKHNLQMMGTVHQHARTWINITTYQKKGAIKW